MLEDTKNFLAYQGAQADLERKYTSPRYFISYRILREEGKRDSHIVKVYKRGLSGEGTTEDDKKGAYEALYKKLMSAELPKNSSYNQEVHNHVAKGKGYIRDADVNSQGKATVTVWDLVKAGKPSLSKGEAYLSASQAHAI